ncbi:MAG: phage head morphogenesis protein [Bacteroidales bacterium]|nr:phage head morphogenesis protein [Bacteroidales bacterium]
MQQLAEAGDKAAVMRLLYQSYSENLHKAISLAMGNPKADDKYFDLTQQFKANTSHFAAFKAQQATEAIMQADSPEQIKALLNTYNRYQAAEYQVTLMRATSGRQFLKFTADAARNKILPNIKWLPSVSKNRREEHKHFYNKVFAKTDPFWSRNQPGNLWGCKCSWVETSEPTEQQKGSPLPPDTQSSSGLESNPAFTGELFTDRAGYIAGAGKAEREQAEAFLKPLQQHFDQYLNLAKQPEYRNDYLNFDWKNGGMMAVSNERIKQGQFNKQEEKKFDKESNMCKVLFENGFSVEYLKEIEKRYDIIANGNPADLKKTASANHIVHYAKKAIRKQGAELVVFEFENESKQIHVEIQELIKLNIHGLYYFSSDKSKIYEF